MAYIGALSGSQSASSTSTLFGAGSGISGLASGMDTDSIVKGLMQAAQVPLVDILQQRQILQWQQSQYQQVNTALTALQNSVSNLKLQSTFMAQTASSSNSSLVTGTAGPMTPAGSYTVSVQQLARGATVSSSAVLSTDPNYGNATLSSLGVTSSSVTVNINNESFTFDPTKDTINSVLSAITHDTKSGVTGFYDANAGQVVLQTTATGSVAKIQANDNGSGLFANMFKINQAANQVWSPSVTPDATQPGSGNDLLNTGGTVEINGTKFTFSANEKMSDVTAAINGKTSTTGVQATYTNGQLTLSKAAVNGLNLYSPISTDDAIDNPYGVFGAPQGPPQSGAAVDALYTVNGFNSSSPTNSATYNGLTLNLQGITYTTTVSSGLPQLVDNPVTVTVSDNTSAVVQSITDFVKQYNTTMQTVQNLYYQKRNYDYKPLTTDQQAQMTQKQIDQWNQQAQSGLLHNDSLLGGGMDSLNSSVATVVGGQPKTLLNGQLVTLNSLASIGISTIDPINGLSDGATAPGVTSTGWNTYGLLQINTSQLTAALQADPNSVMRMFTNNPNLVGGSGDASQTGVAIQMYNALSTSISSITTEAGISTNLPGTTTTDSSGLLPAPAIDPNADFNTLFNGDSSVVSNINSSLKDLDSRATDMQLQLQDMKTRYQTQFSQMEQALAQLNSQSSAFTSMLGQGQSGG